jgi:hypothetical protein
MTTTRRSRRFSLGDVIPGHGTVTAMTDTAYLVDTGDFIDGFHWVPFYGPRGVELAAPVVGLVSFADGSRYGGAR